MRTLCLGEALVDLVCEAPAPTLADVRAFAPHPGGATANVAIHAARLGAGVELAGGAGEDPWGAWLEAGLEREGVGLEFFTLVPRARTPVAFVTVTEAGEPSYQIYGDGLAAVVTALGPRLEDAVDATDALFFASNTLVGEEERTVTMRARRLALAAEKPVVVDANLRLHRWRSVADATASVNACVPGAFLIRANAEEARVLTGEADPDRAASALLKAGARLVAITLGGDGAILRGEISSREPGVPVRVRSTVGAGDAFTGTMLAHLARTDFYPPAAAASLREAVAAGARACERWGAL